MHNDYRYQLETRKLTGHRQQKFNCPQCGKRKCFVRYVDTRNGFRYIAENVGKCDHQHSCGYHYKPREYYNDNLWAREPEAITYCKPTPPPPFIPIPAEYVLRSHSPKSIFWQWFMTKVAKQLDLTAEQLQHIYDEYHIGATRKGNVIFWQIDHQHQVHGGHIMEYQPDGHRGNYQGWTHIPLIRAGLLPNDFQLYQCLFGQHLLPKRPDDHVCIVESEKTALIMAACFPQYLWLATCGSHGLTAEKAACLKGRRVTIFPDSGCLKEWQAIMSQTKGINYFIDGKMEEYPPNTDLADVLLEEL
jgi:transcription elongation factor Elf1